MIDSMIKFMKKMLMMLLALFFPWLILLFNDNPGGAFLSLILQVTVIGWPFATMWALRTQYPKKENSKQNS